MLRVERIKEMERALDRQSELLARLETLLDELQEAEAAYAALVDYYFSADWREDCAADERGELPAELRRGVLSEDGIYNLICAYQSATARLVETAAMRLKQQ